MKLSEYIRVLPALDRASCEDLISCYKEHRDNHIRRLNRVQAFTEMNYNQVAPEHTMNCLARKIKTLVSVYKDHNPTGGRFFPERFGVEEFRIKCYNEGEDCFSQHVDVGDATSSKRFLSLLFYLNDDFGGGNTVFKLPDKLAVKPVQGDVLIFPPTWQYPHEGKPVIDGTKYIMSTYLHYV